MASPVLDAYMATTPAPSNMLPLADRGASGTSAGGCTSFCSGMPPGGRLINSGTGAMAAILPMLAPCRPKEKESLSGSR